MKRLSIIKQPLFSTINDHLIDYPTPSNLNYFWSFGSLAGLCLLIQIATGIFLAMHYTPHVDLAFSQCGAHNARRRRRMVASIHPRERSEHVLFSGLLSYISQSLLQQLL